MKNAKNDIVRINSMISKERWSVDQAFLSLFSEDLTKLLNEYFDLTNTPKITIDKEGDSLLVGISFFSLSIKNFRSFEY